MNLLGKPLHHTYKLLRVYSAIAISGIFVALLYGLLSAFPQITIWIVVVIVSSFYIDKFILKRIDFSMAKRFITTPMIRLAHRPPVLADFILRALLRSEHRLIVLADFHEIYYKELLKGIHSNFRFWGNANFLYWKEVILSIVPLITWRLRSGLLDSAMPVELRENARDVLPFYRRHSPQSRLSK